MSMKSIARQERPPSTADIRPMDVDGNSAQQHLVCGQCALIWISSLEISEMLNDKPICWDFREVTWGLTHVKVCWSAWHCLLHPVSAVRLLLLLLAWHLVLLGFRELSTRTGVSTVRSVNWHCCIQSSRHTILCHTILYYTILY